MRKIIVGKIFLATLVLVALLYLGISVYIANAMTSRLAPSIEISPEVISKNYEEVDFQALDGINLKGWLFRSKGKNLIIMVSGLLPNRANVEYLAPMIAKELIEGGYNVLLYDTRSHGLSEGARVGYGSVEGNDVMGAVQFAQTKDFVPKNIGIIADSTGAISTLMVIDQLKEIGPIVLDSTATEFRPIISDRLWKEKLIPPFFHPTIFFFNKTFFGVDLSIIRPIDKIKLAPKRKFLFLHGAQDETIPLKNSQELLADANKKSRLVVFYKGSHIETYKSDPDLYRKEVYSFLEKGFQQK
ncbi:MAG: alpha/beta hydrolase [Candidatus Woykebacteria bacterium]